jgi:hypothetical protein
MRCPIQSLSTNYFQKYALICCLVLYGFLNTAQNPGISYGFSKADGQILGLHVSDIHNRIGAYCTYYRYNYDFPCLPAPVSMLYAMRSIPDDSIVANFYQGITIGINYLVKWAGERHPIYLWAGLGNIDRTELHKVYTCYTFCDNSGNEWEDHTCTYYTKMRKMLSPELGISIAAYTGKYFEGGLKSAWKRKVGCSGEIYITVKLKHA